MSDDFTAQGLDMLRKAGFPVAGIHDTPAEADRPGDRDQQQAASSLFDHMLACGVRNEAIEMLTAALAAARAEGDQLRRRLETLAKEMEREAVRVPQVGRMAMADRLRAALDAE